MSTDPFAGRPLVQLPRRVFDGFGMTQRGASPFLTPTTAEELAAIFQRASSDGFQVCLRGNGRSYGDAAVNSGALVVDMRHMDQVLSWDGASGVIEAQPGMTIQQLWQHCLRDGWWPPVTPGTSHPTLGGCVAMNIHGKNHYKLGGFGDHVLELDLVTPAGEQLTLSREQNEQLFHAVLGGFGMLGVVTRVKLQMKRVHGGRLLVRQWTVPDLHSQFQAFSEARHHDYYVSWLDCMNEPLGRGQLHSALYTREGEDPEGRVSLDPSAQSLPGSMMGVPMPLVPPLLKVLYATHMGVSVMNHAKYHASRLGSTQPYFQSHAAFHFLLDQMPGFREAYLPGGFIQYQPFVPADSAEDVFREILAVSKRRGLVSYLGVLKRYRDDDFLLSHALDGYSLALDYPVTAGNREALWKMLQDLSDVVLDAGGKFYPAKDSILRPDQFQRAWGQEALTKFSELRKQVDPKRVLMTGFARRVGLEV